MFGCAGVLVVLVGWRVAGYSTASGAGCVRWCAGGLCCGAGWLVATRSAAGLDLVFACCFIWGRLWACFVVGLDSYPQPAQKRRHGAVVWLLWLFGWRGCWLAGCGFVLCSLPIATGTALSLAGATPFEVASLVGAGVIGEGIVWCKHPISEKEKFEKTKKSILSPFKGMKILGWYSCTIL